MTRSFTLLTSLLVLLSLRAVVCAQSAGSRAKRGSTLHYLRSLDAEEIHSHIVVNGTAQVRVQPTDIRLIWAIAEEAQDATTCQHKIDERLRAMRREMESLGLSKDQLADDFISAIPKFEWVPQPLNEPKLLEERQTGFRMQSNLHVAVDTNAMANRVIRSAIDKGLAELIGVDYSAELEEARTKTLRQAVSAAKKKAEVIFEAAGIPTPLFLNAQEDTAVFFPQDMYESSANVAAEEALVSSDEGLPRIRAYRPQNTYYAGVTRSVDRRRYELAMQPEIVIESVVQLYYQSPGAPSRPAKVKDKEE